MLWLFLMFLLSHMEDIINIINGLKIIFIKYYKLESIIQVFDSNQDRVSPLQPHFLAITTKTLKQNTKSNDLKILKNEPKQTDCGTRHNLKN